MIKGVIYNKKNGRTYLVFGLSNIEIAKLKEGTPLGFHMDAFGFDGEPHMVIMMHNQTYDAVKEDMQKIETSPMGLVFPNRKELQ